MVTHSSANKALAGSPARGKSETAPQSEEQCIWRRLGWFVGLWFGGVFVLGVVGYSIRAWLGLS
ncbi:hypothetical protein [Kiloniella sp. EL199]|uniref:hypothetical protein n=1 Tax=Kiloniella sp. EL199 TaxID=2107581 RepID=UPI000EA06EDC|nr:hypothetical protein [Kiloniella sp. EL199]